MKEILFFRSPDAKFIYLLLCGFFCPNEKKFYEIFPLAVKVSEKEFDRLHDDTSAELVTVGDQQDVDNLLEARPELIVINSEKK